VSKAELQTIVQMLRSQPLLKPTLEETRASFEQMAAAFPPSPDVKSQPVDAGGVPAEWLTAPGAREDRVILYLHGGGYVIGSINTHRDLVGRLSRASGARGLAVGYRLAPEHPHPAAVDDAVTAYRWLLKQGVNPSGIVVAGDSAGGGLAIATLVALRDAGDPMPAAGVGISPWVDLEGIGESMTGLAAEDPLVQKDGLLQLAAMYLGGSDPRTPLAAPLYANLAGLPPLLILVGTSETLLDDAERLAERARKAGVDVTYEASEGMIHVWQLFASMLSEGRESIERIGRYIRERTG
jgi:acetyl esterase/lipase